MSNLQEEIQTTVHHYVSPLVHSSGPPSPSQAPGGMVGVFLGGNAYYYPFGRINEAGDAPTEDTIFGLGSVTKTFTTAILGQRPELFGQSVAPHVPAGIQRSPDMPTFEQLATFTGGILPSSPPGVTTQEEFVRFVNTVELIHAADPEWRLPTPSVYSDSSIGLLGQTLMNMAGHNCYDAPSALQWYRNNLLSPLGMESTVAGPPLDDPRLATPYACDKGHYQEVKYPGWCPWGTAGRMYSTAADMVRFIMAAVDVETIDDKPVPAKVRSGINQALQPWAVMSSPSTCYELADSRQGFAWVIWTPEPVHGSVIHSKAGGITGVSSYLAVNPQYRYGVIVLLNQFHVRDQCPTLGIMRDLVVLAAS